MGFLHGISCGYIGSVRGDASVCTCVYGESTCESVRGVACAVCCVCGSWDPLALLGPVLGPWVCFDDLGVCRYAGAGCGEPLRGYVGMPWSPFGHPFTTPLLIEIQSRAVM